MSLVQSRFPAVQLKPVTALFLVSFVRLFYDCKLDIFAEHANQFHCIYLMSLSAIKCQQPRNWLKFHPFRFSSQLPSFKTSLTSPESPGSPPWPISLYTARPQPTRFYPLVVGIRHPTPTTIQQILALARSEWNAYHGMRNLYLGNGRPQSFRGEESEMARDEWNWEVESRL